MAIIAEGLKVTIDRAAQKPEEFTVRLSEVWVGIGYSSKQKCEQGMRAYLDEGLDWIECSASDLRVFNLEVKKPSGGRPVNEFLLKGDAFKELCLTANTKEGRECRHYYIRAEKEYRRMMTASLNRSTVDLGSLYQQLGSQAQEIDRLKEQVKALQSDRENLRNVSGSLYAERPDATTMVYNLAQVRAIVGYKDAAYTFKVIRECMIEGRDYKILSAVEGSEDLMLTEAALQELAIVARSGRGCRSNYLPELLVVEKSRLLPVGTGRSNTRHGQSFC